MNNKGFAITTILYGTFLLFLMLMLAMLGILSRYKGNMELLIDETNGARNIVNVYNGGKWLMSINGRDYYKVNDGVAIIGAVYEGTYTGPVLISTDPDAVLYSTDDRIARESNECNNGLIPGHAVCEIDKTKNFVIYKGTKYYYSSSMLWMGGVTEIDADTNVYGWKVYKGADVNSLKDGVIKLLNEKVKYLVNDKGDSNVGIAT